MNSLWKDTSNIRQFQSLDSDIKTDVLIIGGGITGILTAYLLDKKGIDYCLVEGNEIASGTTANTTAKITLQHGAIFNDMILSLGKEKAEKYVAANVKAIDLLKEVCEGKDYDLEIKDNFVYSLFDKEKMEKEVEALQMLGVKAEFCEKVALPFGIAGAVKVPMQAQFHPLKFINGISENLKIYENTFITEIKNNVAYTKNFKINAKKIIVTTHFPFINRYGGYFLKLYQHRSYVLALKNAAFVDGMYIEDEQDGLSFRNYGEYLLLGGGDHRTGKSGGGYKELREFAKENYENSKEVYHWAAQDCMSLDELPYIGQYSALCPNIYTATGFNKWGMTGSAVSAMVLSDLVLGVENNYAEIFSPSRSILKRQLAINSFETISNVFKLKTPRCTHLGCALKWNKYEHTWDCACHGSRFSADGKVIENPAMRDL